MPKPGRNDNPFSNEVNRANSGGNFDFFREAFDADPLQYAKDRLKYSARVPAQIRNLEAWNELTANGAAAAPRENPYNIDTANQARDGQVSALDALYNGTSVVGAQAGQAMGQLGRQLSKATSGGGGLEQAMASQAGAEGGLAIAGQAGDSRLAEFMKQQQAAGAGYGSARGQDLGVASARRGAGFDARRQDDAMSSLYSDAGVRVGQAQKDLALNNDKLLKRMVLAKMGKNQDTAQAAAETTATLVKMFAGG